MSDLIFRAESVMAREVEVIKSQLRRNYVTIWKATRASWTRIPSRSKTTRVRSCFAVNTS